MLAHGEETVVRFDAGLVEVKPPSDLDLQGVAAERGLAMGQCRKPPA